MSNESNKIEEKKLREILTGIRKTKNSRDKMGELVEHLVDEETLKSCCYGENYRTFCEAYTIKLFKEYIHDAKDRQLMLAIYGLLDGYRGESITERCKKYAEEAAEFDERIKSDWSDPNGSLRNIEESDSSKNPGIKDKLIVKIITAMSKKETCKFAKEVNQELSKEFPMGLPKELPLNRPLYLSIEDPDPPDNPTRQWIIEVVIIATILFIFIVFLVLFWRDHKGQQSTPTDSNIYQVVPSNTISFPDGIFVSFPGSATVTREQDGDTTIIRIDRESVTEAVEYDDENNYSQEGVDNHEENR